jgi:hypothetical protein
MPRPKFEPTYEQRELVRSMAGVGIPQEDIGVKIGIRCPKTLRKHFREELDSGSTDANYNVACTLYNMAISGNVPAATIFWAKTRLGFREHPATDVRPVVPPAFIIAAQQGGQNYDRA